MAHHYNVHADEAGFPGNPRKKAHIQADRFDRVENEAERQLKYEVLRYGA